jgi:hypothetical protein
VKRAAATKPRWSFEASTAILDADQALWALAEMERRAWCLKFGGEYGPDEGLERMQLRAAFEPDAQKLLDKLLSMPRDDRIAVAHRLRTFSPPDRPASGTGEGTNG